MALIVNLFGVPGAGKSTGAAYIFSELKMAGINAELVQEFVKDKVYEESVEVFKNQAYIFGKQYFRISRVADKVDVIVTDSPILLSSFYNNDPLLGNHFDRLLRDVFHSYHSLNYLVNRTKPYNPAGRFQTEDESNNLALPMRELLEQFHVSYAEINGDKDGYSQVIKNVIGEVKHSV